MLKIIDLDLQLKVTEPFESQKLEILSFLKVVSFSGPLSHPIFSRVWRKSFRDIANIEKVFLPQKEIIS